MHDRKRDLLWQTRIITEVYFFCSVCYSKSSSLVNRNDLFHDTSTESTNKITHAHETEQGTPIAAQERGLEARRWIHMRGDCSRCRTRPRSSSHGRGGCSRVGPCAERRGGGGCPGCHHCPLRMSAAPKRTNRFERTIFFNWLGHNHATIFWLQ